MKRITVLLLAVAACGCAAQEKRKVRLEHVPVHHPNQYVFVGVKWTGTAAISDTVAVCNVDDKGKPHNCKLENGHTLDDLVEIVIETAEQSQPAK
jgi:hypothetical protein